MVKFHNLDDFRKKKVDKRYLEVTLDRQDLIDQALNGLTEEIRNKVKIVERVPVKDKVRGRILTKFVFEFADMSSVKQLMIKYNNFTASSDDMLCFSFMGIIENQQGIFVSVEAAGFDQNYIDKEGVQVFENFSAINNDVELNKFISVEDFKRLRDLNK